MPMIDNKMMQVGNRDETATGMKRQNALWEIPTHHKRSSGRNRERGNVDTTAMQQALEMQPEELSEGDPIGTTEGTVRKL